MPTISRTAMILVLATALRANGAVLHGGVHCAATAEAAVESWLGRAASADEVEGYRVLRIRQDGLRRHRWALVEHCGHPEAPLRALELADDVIAVEQTAGPRIGDSVRIVRREASSVLELEGVALSAGSPGQIVRVRLRSVSTDPAAAPVELRCRVIAAGLVEVWQ